MKINKPKIDKIDVLRVDHSENAKATNPEQNTASVNETAEGNLSAPAEGTPISADEEISEEVVEPKAAVAANPEDSVEPTFVSSVGQGTAPKGTEENPQSNPRTEGRYVPDPKSVENLAAIPNAPYTENLKVVRSSSKEKYRLKAKAIRNDRRLYMIFLCSLLVVGLLFLVWPKKEKSDTEKRALATRPEWSLENILSGGFSSGYESYYADQFPLRRGFINLYRRLKKIYTSTPWISQEESIEFISATKDDGGQGEQLKITPTPPANRETQNVTVPTTAETTDPIESMGTTFASTTADNANTNPSQSTATTSAVPTTTPTKPTPAPGEDMQVHDLTTLIIYRGRAMEIYYYDEGTGSDYAARLNKLRSQLPADRRVISMIVPTAMAFYGTDELMAGPHDQQAAIQSMYSMMDPNIIKVDAYSELAQHTDQYLYYRTDHHWNGRGAYYAYKAFCQAMGEQATPLESMKLTQPADTFFGSLYGYTNESDLLKNSADRAEIFLPKHYGTNNFYSSAAMNDGIPNVLLDAEVQMGNQYLLYIGGDAAVNYIESDNKNGKSIVVVKESYANAFIPYLMDNYERIYVVDARLFNDKLIPFIVDNNIQDVMVLNYTFATANYGWLDGYDAMLH